MNEFSPFNKVTGVYWLKEDLENLKIKVKVKPKDSILTLPKFDEYTNEDRESTTQCESIQEYIFKWQEKVFSAWELHRYEDVHNCITDAELTYHNMITGSSYEPSKVFTYLHDDCYLPLPNSYAEKQTQFSIFDLSLCLDILKLCGVAGNIFKESNSMGHLFHSQEDIDVGNDRWTAMHIVLDNSEYNEDSQLLFKQEAILMSLYHNMTHNYLILSPDVNNLELNPYSLETITGVPLEYQYSTEIDLAEMGNSEELVTLLKKLCKKWEKRHRQLINFTMAPLGRRQHCVTLEILTASNFDLDNLYIEYNIQIPEGVHCDGELHGRTHTSKGLRTDDGITWSYAYIIDLGLDMDINLEPPPIKIFFEAISTDWWCRHRTEGYGYLPLTLQPGRYKKQLSCFRPEEKDRVEAESRRFFVGGCHLIKHLELLAKPQLQDTNFAFVTTGIISLRWDVISQSLMPGTTPIPQPSTSSASALILGAEAVLRQYRKAKAKLAAATKDVGDIRMDKTDIRRDSKDIRRDSKDIRRDSINIRRDSSSDG